MDRDESIGKMDQPAGKADTTYGKTTDRAEKEPEGKDREAGGKTRAEAGQVRQAVSKSAGQLGRPPDHYDDILYQEDDEWIDDRDERTTFEG